MTAAHTVLFVDDEVEILESLCRTVRNEPYGVVTTTSPLEALSRIAAGESTSWLRTSTCRR